MCKLPVSVPQRRSAAFLFQLYRARHSIHGLARERMSSPPPGAVWSYIHVSRRRDANVVVLSACGARRLHRIRIDEADLCKDAGELNCARQPAMTSSAKRGAPKSARRRSDDTRGLFSNEHARNHRQCDPLGVEALYTNWSSFSRQKLTISVFLVCKFCEWLR